TYDVGKPRIRILRDGLRARGVEITEIHKDVWEGIGDKSAMRDMRAWLRRGLRLLGAYPLLIWRYMRAPAHDLVLVSYPGQLDVLVLRPFAWMRRKRIAFDWFISAFDTVVEDRRLLGRRNPLAWMLWTGEWLASRAANLVFMDTAAHARRMEELFRLAPNSVGRVWVGAERAFFESGLHQLPSEPMQVLFYGQFIPLHGIGTIIEAARLLRDAPIRWILVGRGQEAPRIHALLAEEPLPALRWVEWVPYDQLGEWIKRADVCLGIFGTSDKAASVIPNKVFQIVAGGRPLVTRDSPAIRELLTDNPPCVHLVNAGDARALAGAIHDCMKVVQTPTRECHRALRGQIDAAAVAKQFLAMVARHFPEADRANDR
ncbi:MAG: glycosyltransferase, partial [Xanthomonadaceae bacterium]|nr:glycosyltransferase [Xanthomonadaceae bacterium]